MKIRVRLFGALREEAGSRELSVDLEPGARVGDLRRMLAERYATIDRLGEFLAVSVNLKMVGFDQELSDGDEVGLLPPVAGG